MKKLIWISITIIALAFMAYLYVFHKPHRDVTNEEVRYEMSAQNLVQQFQNDRALADSLYLDQVVAIRGILSELKPDAVSLSAGIYAKLDSNTSTPAASVGDSITIRGRVISFDDLFSEVRIDFAECLDQ